MLIREAMTPSVRTITPSTSLSEAACIMAEIDAGALPVVENDKLVGMLTDRDIAIRGIACGKTGDTPTREAMTNEVLYCFEDDEADDVCENMADIQVRRLPVVNRSKRLVGIVSLADLATKADADCARALEGIAQPGGLHTQSNDGLLAQRP